MDWLFFLVVKILGWVFVLYVLCSLEGEIGGLLVWVLELVVWDKVCEYLDKVCYGEFCFLV